MKEFNLQTYFSNKVKKEIKRLEWTIKIYDDDKTIEILKNKIKYQKFLLTQLYNEKK